MHLGAGTQCSATILRLLAGVLVVRLSGLRGRSVLAGRGDIRDGPPRGVHIGVTGVLHQLRLCLFEPLSFALASLNQWPVGLTWATIGRGRL
jgi:hypothetical protein